MIRIQMSLRGEYLSHHMICILYLSKLLSGNAENRLRFSYVR